MQSTSLRLPLQSPPVSRALVAHQGHQHSGGIEAAQCAGTAGLGDCHQQSGWVDHNTDCESCCFRGNRPVAVRWVSNNTGLSRFCSAPTIGLHRLG
jgi:hypothetical protein